MAQRLVESVGGEVRQVDEVVSRAVEAHRKGIDRIRGRAG